ncbi:MAG: hypothetical protein A2V83_08445 [Nitrospirae bacterium RBG_16_64_22]|nr:MAG: hypothetical protein A2V83_08445 [Nitrospirae bacterium RBG_16_64_22]
MKPERVAEGADWVPYLGRGAAIEICSNNRGLSSVHGQFKDGKVHVGVHKNLSDRNVLSSVKSYPYNRV